MSLVIYGARPASCVQWCSWVCFIPAAVLQALLLLPVVVAWPIRIRLLSKASSVSTLGNIFQNYLRFPSAGRGFPRTNFRETLVTSQSHYLTSLPFLVIVWNANLSDSLLLYRVIAKLICFCTALTQPLTVVAPFFPNLFNTCQGLWKNILGKRYVNRLDVVQEPTEGQFGWSGLGERGSARRLCQG